MKTVAIIQARLQSSRLPYKVLMSINGQSMLTRVIQRVKRASLVNKIVLAVADSRNDRPVFRSIAEDNKIELFFGSEEDVLDRYYQAASIHGAGTIVRITSDCPLIVPSIIDLMLSIFLNDPTSPDYFYNTEFPGSYPDGMDVEVFSYEALRSAWAHASLAEDREHVGYYFKHNPDLYVTRQLPYRRVIPGYHWSVNTQDDLDFVRSVYTSLGDSFSVEDIIHWVEGDMR